MGILYELATLLDPKKYLAYTRCLAGKMITCARLRLAKIIFF